MNPLLRAAWPRRILPNTDKVITISLSSNVDFPGLHVNIVNALFSRKSASLITFFMKFLYIFVDRITPVHLKISHALQRCALCDEEVLNPEAGVEGFFVL